MILINALLCSVLSFSLFWIIQKYISIRQLTDEHAFVSILLSPGIYCITVAISDNWALSLGMIGALSIVRFRNPVRSSYELTLFFIYIVIGIAISVNIYFSLTIWLMAIIGTYIVENYYKKIILEHKYSPSHFGKYSFEKQRSRFSKYSEALLKTKFY
tara:strand:+ start:250 stop:723 length:474 start_codon:yes stop_codon:yes gene_type:complete